MANVWSTWRVTSACKEATRLTLRGISKSGDQEFGDHMDVIATIEPKATVTLKLPPILPKRCETVSVTLGTYPVIFRVFEELQGGATWYTIDDTGLHRTPSGSLLAEE